MKTDYVSARPVQAQVRSSRPGIAEVLQFSAKAFCVIFTVLFLLLKIYDLAKHIG